MRNFKILFICLLASTQSRAEEYCKSAKGPAEIKAALTCQTSLSLTACGGLGGYIAGRKITEKLKSSALKYMENRSQGHRAIAEKAFEFWKSKFTVNASEYISSLENELSSKQTQLNDAKNALAEYNSNYKNIPFQSRTLTEQLQNASLNAKASDLADEVASLKERKEAAEAAAKKTGQRFIQRPIFDGKVDIANSSFDKLPRKTASLYERLTDLVVSGYDGNLQKNDTWMLERIEDSLVTKEIYTEAERPKVAKELLKTMRETNLRRKNALLEDAVKLTRKASGKIPLLAGGAVGVGLFVLSEATDVRSTACSSVSEGYRNSDPNNACKGDPKKIAEGDVRFLQESPEKQAELMSAYPDLCKHSSEMHKQLLEQPKFLELKCHREGSQIKGFSAVTSSGKFKTSYTVKMNEGRISSMRTDASGSLPFTMKLNETEELTNYDFENGSQVQHLSLRKNVPNSMVSRVKFANEQRTKSMLFMPELKECCATNDDSYAQTCMNYFNGSSKSEKRQGVSNPEATEAVRTTH